MRPTGMSGGYTLDAIQSFMASIGNPQDAVQVIHVAGTSGKTSAADYIASLLNDAGHKVGLSTSPHLSRVSERALIDMCELSEKDYCEQFFIFDKLVRHSNIELSYFEILVAFAYWLFAQKSVDFAVIEVGLGGLLDGTNIVSNPSKVAVITDIGFDHVEVLGHTLPEIAAQKAGIIKSGNAVFMNAQSTEVMEVIANASKEADLHVIRHELELDLPKFQRRNAALAVAVVDFVTGQTIDPVDVLTVSVPGRMEIINYQSRTLILDGSHNQQKMAALVDAMLERFSGRSIGLLVSFGENKRADFAEALKELRRLSSDITLTSFTGYQDEVRTSIPTDELRSACESISFDVITVIDDPNLAVQDAISRHDVVLITGSFFLLQQLRSQLIAKIGQ